MKISMPQEKDSKINNIINYLYLNIKKKYRQSARGVSSIGKALKIPRIAFYDQVKGQGQIIQMIQDKNQIV